MWGLIKPKMLIGRVWIPRGVSGLKREVVLVSVRGVLGNHQS